MENENGATTEERGRPSFGKRGLKCVKLYFPGPKFAEVKELARLRGYSSVGPFLKNVVLPYWQRTESERAAKLKDLELEAAALGAQVVKPKRSATQERALAAVPVGQSHNE